MKNAVNKLFSAEKGSPILFLVMIYIAGAVTNALSDVLKNWMSPVGIVLLGTGLIIALILILDPVPRLVKSFTSKHGELSPEMISPEKHKGLIVFASKGPNISAEEAIRYHLPTLKRCWIISGDDKKEEGSSYRAANELIAKMIKGDVPLDLFELKPMKEEDVHNPIKSFEHIESIFNELPEGFNEADIISDYTGGTKSMTAGMILSCALPSRDLQVLIPKAYKEDGTAVRGDVAKPIMINIDFKLKKVTK
jgi:hypothetical protein